MEKALGEREAQLNSIIESIPFDVFALDNEQRYILQNTPAKRVWGDIVGKRPEDLGADEETLRLWLDNNRRALSGETVHEEVSFPIGGEIRHFTNIISPIQDEGETRGIVGINIDITDRRRAEEALRLTQFSIDHSSDAAFWLRPDNRFFYVNEAAVELTGYSREELIGMTLDQVAPDYPPEVWPAQWNRLRESKSYIVEARCLRKDGSFVPIEVRTNYMNFEGLEVDCAFARDISGRIKARKEKEALIGELESKNTELERYTYTVSHDLKTPLITIRGFLDLLRRDLERGETTRINERIDRIDSAADRMQRMLEELLELSRIGQMKGNIETIPLGELVQEALDLAAGLLSSAHAEIIVAPDLPTVRGDRIRLMELFHNLFDNAVKFSTGNHPPRIEIGVRHSEAQAVITVKDNGIGISKDFHQKIFGLFDKLNRNTDGSGVGLAISQRIVEIHGGRIWVESEGEGRGSTFCFTLPREQEEPD